MSDAGKRPAAIKNNNMIYVIVFAAVIVAVMIIFNVILGGAFLDWSNIKGIISHIVYPSLVAWAFCFIFACGYTDMSIGSVLVLGSFAACIFGNWYGLAGVVLGGLITGLLLICINFLVFTFTGIPSWIAGISLAMVYEALAFYLKINNTTKSLVATSLDRQYRLLGQLPASLILMFIVMVIVYIVYNRSTIGLNIRALGGNKDVAGKLGINVNKTLIAVGLICGVLIGMACFVQQSYAGQTTVKTGLTSINLIFQPLAIYLLAQIIQKRINIIICVPICAFILYAVFNVLTALGVPSGTLQEAFLGGFIIIFGILGSRGVKGVVK